MYKKEYIFFILGNSINNAKYNNVNFTKKLQNKRYSVPENKGIVNYYTRKLTELCRVHGALKYILMFFFLNTLSYLLLLPKLNRIQSVAQ